MDTLRGNFSDREYDDQYDAGDDEVTGDAPPPEIGTDERRMQVRAYNHWASMLADRNFPSIDELKPEELPDFGPYSVLLDFTPGIEDPAVRFLGDELAGECEAEIPINRLSDVPSRSLLSRITDHYLQILANQAPIGFEAEFVNQRGATILYRGILLPFSSDDENIDFILGVINWKEMADQITTDELLLEIDQALEEGGGSSQLVEDDVEPIADWADGPGAPANDELGSDDEIASDNDDGDEGPVVKSLGLSPLGSAAGAGDSEDAFPQPAFGLDEEYGEDEGEEEAEDDNRFASLLSPVDEDEDEDGDLEPIFPTVESNEDQAPIPVEYEAPVVPEMESEAEVEFVEEPELESPAAITEDEEPVSVSAEPVEEIVSEESDATVIELPETASDEAEGLYDCLAAARELAQAARSSEDRSRAALYAAVGRAYDVSLSAKDEPEEFDQLVADNGLSVQDRAPMTPVVKLVFGADYDKTRLTEYAAVLSHAHREQVERGSLADYLTKAEGGLKGVVNAERRLRREEAGKPVVEREGPRERLAKKLRALEPQSFDAIHADGPEFALVMVRRMPDGTVAVIGEVGDDVPLIEKVGRKLVG